MLINATLLIHVRQKHLQTFSRLINISIHIHVKQKQLPSAIRLYKQYWYIYYLCVYLC